MLNDTIVKRLRGAQHIAVFTGAGMSAESGVPTFRDRSRGLWAKHNPEEVATPVAFQANPQFVWDWHVYLAETIRQAAPNPGHVAIANLERWVPKVTVLTQNIDNLHQAAGSSDIVEMHGNLFRLKSFVDEDEMFSRDASPIICPVCNGYAIADDCDTYASKEDLAGFELRAGLVPRCPGCCALLRPDIVWFGEPLDIDILDDSMRLADICDIMICVGSSLAVHPAASIPFRAKLAGAMIIEINREPTKLSSQADIFLQGKAAELLPTMFENVWGGM